MKQESIDSAEIIKPGLWSVKDVFDLDYLNATLRRIEQETVWVPMGLQKKSQRRCLPWTNGLIADLKETIDSLDFSKFGFKLNTITVWKDTAGYIINEHVDNDRVIGSMQIYLNDAPRNLGTWFGDTEIPFVQNTGYIMDNKHKALHNMRCVVPIGVSRYSLYTWFDYI